MTKALALLFLSGCCMTGMPQGVLAFQPSSSGSRSTSPTAGLQRRGTALNAAAAADSNNDRRNFLVGVLGTATATLIASSTSSTGSFSPVQPASASYSAYTHREQDWQERLDHGQIQISTARDLKAQLQEIVPVNSESSKIFCPNGPSAAVSPLMENKCGDRQAAPSVYGRTEDVLGNSIPGFGGGDISYTADMRENALGKSLDKLGGFPTYQKEI